MDIQKGDRIVVTNSLYGMYDGKKGVVHRVLENGEVEVILDINRGRIDQITRLFMKNIEREIILTDSPIIPKAEVKSNKTEIVSIDDRLDALEEVLSTYSLSVKDNCGFMYIYDFIDELSNKWQELEEKDKEDVVFYILGENFKKV